MLKQFELANSNSLQDYFKKCRLLCQYTLTKEKYNVMMTLLYNVVTFLKGRDEMAEDTRQNILDRGKEEFLRKGFEGASLRVIAKAAGVTTGAIYGYFPDKKALFDALVAQPTRELLDQFRATQEEFATLPPERQAIEMVQTSGSGMIEMVEHIYRHYDAFKLLVCSTAGTEYAAYLNQMVEIEVQSTFRFIEAMHRIGKQVRDVDEPLAHILVNSLFSGIFEIVAHDMPAEKAMGYVNGLKEFYTAGWFQILGLERQ